MEPEEPSTGDDVGPGRPRVPRPSLDAESDWRARWEVLRADRRVAAAALALVAAGAGALWLAWGRGGEGEGRGDPAATEAAVVATSTTTAPAELVVHVAGAVVQPGVVRLAGSARVGDAVAAAGGAAGDADVDRLNLAAPVTDGERIYVARVGELVGPAPLGSGPGRDEGADGPLDLNAATVEDLEELPGIGPVLAEAIVAERDRRGGFRSVNELRDVRGIGEARFAELEAHVRV